MPSTGGYVDAQARHDRTVLALLLTFHVFVNIGMTIGVMPVTGLPLPFLSSGGSSLFSNLIAIGLLLHIYTYRHEY